MKISGGNFDSKSNELSLRSIIDAQLQSSKEKIHSEKLNLLNQQQQNPQSIFATLISSKLASSHASIFTSLNSKGEGKLVGHSLVKSNYFSKFSSPIQSPQTNSTTTSVSTIPATNELIRDEFEKFKQIKKNSLNSYNKQIALNSHLISLTNKSQLQFNKNNSTPVRKVFQVSSSPSNKLKDRKHSTNTSRNSMRSKPVAASCGNSVMSYSNHDSFNKTGVYRTSLKSAKQERKLNDKLNVFEASRPVTVKLFGSTDFKMNLPPINKLKLFSNSPTNDEFEAVRRQISTATSKRSQLTVKRRNSTSRNSILNFEANLVCDNNNNNNNSEQGLIDKMCQLNLNNNGTLNWPANESAYHLIADYYFNKAYAESSTEDSITKCPTTLDTKSDVFNCNEGEEETLYLYNERDLRYLTLWGRGEVKLKYNLSQKCS